MQTSVIYAITNISFTKNKKQTINVNVKVGVQV